MLTSEMATVAGVWMTIFWSSFILLTLAIVLDGKKKDN